MFFSHKPKGNTNKMSKYNFAAAKETLSLPSNANCQQIAFHAAVSDPETTPTVKSPLKKEYKVMLLAEHAKNEMLLLSVEQTDQDLHRHQHPGAPAALRHAQALRGQGLPRVGQTSESMTAAPLMAPLMRGFFLPPVGASTLAMDVNDNAGHQVSRGVLATIASMLAPTGVGAFTPVSSGTPRRCPTLPPAPLALWSAAPTGG